MRVMPLQIRVGTLNPKVGRVLWRQVMPALGAGQ
jgi:hypothetical protein